MERKLKLSKKQLELITNTQKQKEEIGKLLQDINLKEATIVELILDANLVTNLPKDIRFDGESLILTFEDIKAKTSPQKVENVELESK